MAIIQVQGQRSGRPYSINIAGSTPTPEEQEKINQFVSQREAEFESFFAERFGTPQVEAPVEAPPEDDGTDRTAFGRGYVREPFQTQRAFGVAEEALADTAFGRFLGFSAEEARARQAAAEAELRRLEAEDPSVKFEDISGVGTAASFVGEQLGSEARDVAIQTGATATGAGIGAIFGGFGAAPGAAIGRGVGVAYTTAKAAPQMFAEAIEAQREGGGEVSLSRALGATAVNLLSEAVADYFVIGKLIPREAKSRVGSAVKNAIEAGTAEGSTEVFQQAVIRGQAGQDLTSPEALMEYAEALAAGMSVGGTIGGVGGLLSTPDRSAQDELDQDYKELALEGSRRFRFAEETEQQIEAERQKAMAAAGIDPDAPLGLEAPQQRLGLPAPESVDVAPETTITDSEFENRTFDRAQYERVLQQIKADITSDKPINVAAIHQRVKSDLPGVKVSQVKDVLTELQARGFIAENPVPKKQKYIPMGALAPEVKTPDVSYRRQIDTATDFIKADQSRIERLNYDLQSAEAYGRDLDGNRATPNQINAEIAKVEQRIADNQQRIDVAQQRLQTLGQDMHVPRFERVGLPRDLKAVPIPEAAPEALRPRFEAQQQAITGYKEQLASIKKQIVKLNEQAKKRQLSSNELNRMQKLQQSQGEISTRLAEAQANLKTPEKIVQEAKGEQFREQERQREIERKLAAAQARAAADQVKAQEDQGVSPLSDRFNAKQDAVFKRLQGRLSNLGLKGVKLDRRQKIDGAEGSFDPLTRVLTLAMGLYNPNLSEQQLFNAIAEVMDHEIIHALKALGALTPKEFSMLEKAAGKTRYVKLTNQGVQKRSYTYLDRAKKLYPDLNETQQKEEAVAEMFRDYVAGRLKIGGGPRAFLEKIKKFFKALVGANVDEGFTSVQDIFNNISVGRIGERVAPAAAPAAQSAVTMQSRISAMPKNVAESIAELKDFMASRPSKDQIENHPSVLRIVEEMSSRPETIKSANYGSPEWHSSREYVVGGSIVRGTNRLLPVIMQESMRLPYIETGRTPVVPDRGRKAFVLIGAPAAGKSTIANEIAITNNAAIPDADQVKTFIPEYDGGIGAAAVHEESVELLAAAQKEIVERGYNIVAQKVGHSDNSIRKLIKSLKDADYNVSLINMYVDPDEAFRRMIGRFIRTGRIVPPDYFNSIGNRPRLVYNRIKEERIADGYAEIDNNGGVDDPKPILDIAGENPLAGSRFDPQRGGSRAGVGFTETGGAGVRRVLPQTGREQGGEARLGATQLALSRLPTLPMAPDGTRAHKLPSQLLMRGTGAPPSVRITQQYTIRNAAANNAAIQQILDQYPDAILSEANWAEATQAAFGGEYIPVPPMVAIQYAQSAEKMADKLRRLTPELKSGVDRGFEYVRQIRDIYNSGNATPRMTLDLFVWGILSRGAGPVQQEGAFIDIIDSAYPFLEEATRRPLTDSDTDRWLINVSGSIPEGSPGKQVTMNANAAANLVRAMSQPMPNSDQTVLMAVHEAMSDPNISGTEIRQLFLSNTEGAGIDNKVLSFILLVGGKDDVLVMDRIQGRHLWDDGRYGGANIYDGIGSQGEGLNGVFRGPYGILTTRMLENGLRRNVQRAYEMIGRPEDASLGRFHWETWVIEGEQVVSHDTLAAIINSSPIGQSVTEGKTDTFSSGMTYRRGEAAAVVEYPLSDDTVVYMTPVRFKEFTTAISDDAKKAKSSTGIFKEGKFKVTARADIPWFDRPEVDRNALDAMAREYENAKPDGSVLVGIEGAGEGQDASQRGNSDIDRRYSRVPTGEVRPERARGRGAGPQAGKLAPLEGAPVIEGATGPDENLIAVAEQYAADNGIDLRRQSEFVNVDPRRAKRIADAYEAMEHRPQDPRVQDAYANLIRQTRAQYDALVDAGYEFTFFDSETDPYDGNPWNAMRDLRANKRMAVYGTYDGYGTEGITGAAIADNPILADTGLRWKDQRGVERPVTANDLFRAVHDAFGHGLEGAGFRARGEENAWQAHVRLFTGSAVPAITSETRGQNSWLNYGPYGERNRTAALEDTVFAEQKTGLMPEWTWQEGRVGDAQGYDTARKLDLVPEQQSIQAGMTPEEVIEIEAPLAGLEIDPEMPKQMYSRVPVAQAYMPVRAPVDMKDGSPNSIYGSIREGARLLPVVLPKGSHVVYDNGIEAGNGLFHIQQRKHDLELFENSKYKRVENAIYDLMRRWQTQGYDDGNDVISYPSGGNLVLEWREKIGFGAPPLTLILERGSDARGAPVKDAYYVKTFYPVLEKKDRMTQVQRGRNFINMDKGDSRRRFSRLLSSTAPTQGTPQFGPSDLETVMQNLRYTGVQEKVANVFKKIGKPFKADEKAIEDGTQWVFNKLQDNFVSVGKMYDALRKQGANITRDMDAYFQELLMHGVAGAKKERFKTNEFTPIVEQVARLNVTDVERDALKRVSNYYGQILEKTGNKSHALANAYLYALHAVERNRRISELSKGQISNGSGMSDQEAQNIISFVNSMDATRRNQVVAIADGVRSMVDGTNDVYIDGGLIPDYKDGVDVDDETKQAFIKYKNYVPLRGFADPESELDTTAGDFSTTNRFGALGKPNKTALGRESYAGDILANVAVQRENAIDKAEKNKVGVAFLNLLESNIDTDAYAEVLERHPLRRVMRNGRITVMPDRDFNDPNLPILAVRRDGEEVLIGFKDPRLATAFKGTSGKQMNAIMGGLNTITRFYANLLTSWNPSFLLSNLPRDIETALFNAQQYNMEGSSKDILKGIAPSFKAIMRTLNNKAGADPYWVNRYNQFYDNGGQNVLNQMGDVVNNSKDIRDTISKIVAADDAGNRRLMDTLWNGTKRGAGSLVNYVEAVNTAVENATRVAFFDAVVRNLEAQGVPTERAVREAAAAARQLTTNFGKGGEMKAGLNTLYLFFNASLQGSMAMFNSLINNSKARKLVATVVVAGFMQDMINGLISGDEDDDGIKDYDNLSDHKLAHSIVLPDLNGDGTFVTIPLAYGINMFYNFGRVMGNLARGAMGDNGTYTPEEAASSTMGTVSETFNPFGGNNFWTFLSPTQLDMPIELMTNQNFMNQPIYRELSPFEQYKSRSGMYWSTTSPSAIWISKFINDTVGGGTDIVPGEVLGKRVDIQPDVIEHVIDFMLGGAGRFVIQMGEAGTTYAPAAIMGQFEEDMVRRTPIVNKFITAVTERDRSGDFYEKRDDVLAIYAELKDAIDNGDRDRVDAVRSRYPEYLPLIQPIRAINGEIRKLNQLKRTVNKNPSLSEERKREIRDKIDERIAAFVARGNQLMLNI